MWRGKGKGVSYWWAVLEGLRRLRSYSVKRELLSYIAKRLRSQVKREIRSNLAEAGVQLAAIVLIYSLGCHGSPLHEFLWFRLGASIILWILLFYNLNQLWRIVLRVRWLTRWHRRFQVLAKLLRQKHTIVDVEIVVLLTAILATALTRTRLGEEFLLQPWLDLFHSG